MKLATIKKEFDRINAEYFKGDLSIPRICNTRSRSTYGQTWADRRNVVMEFNLRAIPEMQVSIDELIFHEMIHQFIDHELELEDDGHHGTWFRYFHSVVGRGHFSYFEELD